VGAKLNKRLIREIREIVATEFGLDQSELDRWDSRYGIPRFKLLQQWQKRPTAPVVLLSVRSVLE
jgi:hypothetical protein